MKTLLQKKVQFLKLQTEKKPYIWVDNSINSKHEGVFQYKIQ